MDMDMDDIHGKPDNIRKLQRQENRSKHNTVSLDTSVLVLCIDNNTRRRATCFQVVCSVVRPLSLRPLFVRTSLVRLHLFSVTRYVFT